jgi:hypothetical protein
MKIAQDLIRATLVVCSCCVLIDTAIAQSTRERRRDEAPPNAKELELRLEKAETALVDEYKDVAIEFYKQGDKEKSMAMLRRLKQLNPTLQGLGDRIAEMSEELMQENANEIELDTRKTWELVGNVFEDKPFRLQASGEYKMTYAATIGVEGLKTDENSKDHIAGAPLGCLLGVIVTDGTPGRPFPVKAELEHTPKKSGQLFLKVNLPDGSRCIGKLKVRFSGYIDSGKKK